MDLMAERSHPIKERILAIGVLLRRVGCLVTEKKQEQIPAAISQLMERIELEGALSHHRVGHSLEARDVGARHQVVVQAILFGISCVWLFLHFR